MCAIFFPFISLTSLGFFLIIIIPVTQLAHLSVSKCIQLAFNSQYNRMIESSFNIFDFSLSVSTCKFAQIIATLF